MPRVGAERGSAIEVIVVVEIARVVAAAQEQGVRVSALGPRMIRAVTHLEVTTAQCLTAGAVLGDLLVS